MPQDYQLIQCDPRRSKYLACALMARGQDVHIADLTRNVERLQKKVDMIHWNREGFKIGLCGVPPIGQPYSLLSLCNNVCFGDTLQRMSDTCMKLYRVRAHLYHYTEYIGQEIFDDALENVRCPIDDYDILDRAVPPQRQNAPSRYQPVV